LEEGRGHIKQDQANTVVKLGKQLFIIVHNKFGVNHVIVEIIFLGAGENEYHINLASALMWQSIYFIRCDLPLAGFW